MEGFTNIMRNQFALAVGLLLAFSGLAAACNHAAAEAPGGKEEAQGPIKVRCAPVEEGTVIDSVALRGTVAPQPERDALVAPQIQGRLLKVTVQEGDDVEEGQIIARVDASSLIDQAAQTDAALERARAENRNAKSTLARTEQVFEKGIAPRQELDDTTERAASAEASEDEAKALSKQAHRQIARTEVRSPLTGVVLKVLRKPGELVDGTPSTPVVEIADTSIL